VTVEWQGPAWLRRPAEVLGVRILHRATKLSLQGPAYSDAAIEHLRELKSLKLLVLEQTKISDQGRLRLQRALPQCRIEHRQPM
jgi:hypothetical protein